MSLTSYADKKCRSKSWFLIRHETSAWAECRRKKDNREMLFFSRMQCNKTCTEALPDFLFIFFDGCHNVLILPRGQPFRKNVDFLSSEMEISSLAK